MRSMFRTVLVAMLSVLALGAVAASAAQAATEGPFYKIAGSRLASGETKEVTSKAYTGFTIDNSLAGEIGCTQQKFASGAKLSGSTGANAGGGTVTLEFSNCTVSGEGEGCQISGGTLKTQPLTVKLAYLNSTRTGHLAMAFLPAKGTTWAEFQYTGSGCKVKAVKITGGIAAELVAFRSEKLEVNEVGKEPAETPANGVEFINGHSIWVEEGGKLVKKLEAEERLEAFGGAVTMAGTSKLELGGSEWGVYTK
jgi:hypothetical protein